MAPETRISKGFQGNKLHSNKPNLVLHTDEATGSNQFTTNLERKVFSGTYLNYMLGESHRNDQVELTSHI